MFWHVDHWFPGFGFSKQSFKEFWNFGSKLLATNLINSIYSNIYPVVIGKAFSPTELGFYSKAGGYAKLVPTTLSGVLTKVSFPVLSDIQNDNIRLGDVYRRMLRVTAYIVFPAAIGLATVASPFITVLITDKWAPSILFLQILCFSTMWSPIHSLNLNLLQVKGRSDLFLKLEVIKKILGIGVIVITLPFGLIYMCIGSVISSLLFLFINTYYTGKFINVSFVRQMKDMAPTLAYSLSMGLVVLIVISFIPSPVLKLFIGAIVGVFYYIAISILTKSSDLAYLRLLIQENLRKKKK